MTRRRQFWSNDAGAAMIEFAIVVVPLLLLIVGVVEIGRMLWTRQAMQSVAITAARCMGIKQSNCTSGGNVSVDTTKNYIISLAGPYAVPLASGDITLNTGSCLEPSIGGMSYVEIDYRFNSIAPALITALTGGKMLKAIACFPNQG